MAGAGHVTSPPGRKPAARNRKIYRQTVPAPSAKRQRRGHGRTSTHARNSTDEQTDRPSTPTTTSHSYGRWSTGSGLCRSCSCSPPSRPATSGGFTGNSRRDRRPRIRRRGGALPNDGPAAAGPQRWQDAPGARRLVATDRRCHRAVGRRPTRLGVLPLTEGRCRRRPPLRPVRLDTRVRADDVALLLVAALMRRGGSTGRARSGQVADAPTGRRCRTRNSWSIPNQRTVR